MKRHKPKHQVFGLTEMIIGTSIGSQIVGEIGGDVAQKGQKGFSNLSNAFPMIGSAIGGGMAINSARMMMKAMPKKRINIKKRMRRID